MYLYKYVSADVLHKILEKNMVRFTQTCYLNDPYEGHIYETPSNEVELEESFKKQIESGEILAKQIYELQIESLEKYPSRLENGISKAREAFRNKYGVFSLSRNPYSLLMWAHYANNHQGCVIELNSNQLPTREKFGDVLFDKNNGAVVYSSIKNENFIKPKLVSSQIGLILSHGKIENLSYIINKSIHWSYEEEVRIVRDLSMECHDEKISLSETGEIIYLYRLEPVAINSIILGERFNDDSILKKIYEKNIKTKRASISKYKFELLIE